MATVIDLEGFKYKRQEFFALGKKIVLCHGVFDLLHPGHLEHFYAASKFGDVLVVSVTSDEFVNKGPGRPIFDLPTRMRALSRIKGIDYVVPSFSNTSVNVINTVKPNYYVKGSEYSDAQQDITGMIQIERNAVEQNGGEIVFTNEITSSSTSIINEHLSPFSLDTRTWLQDFKTKFSVASIMKSIQDLKNLKIGIVGEIIIDSYTRCTPLAKSSKDPILAFQRHETESFRGGVLAIAGNCSEWASHVCVYSHVATLSDGFLTSENSNVEYDLFKSIAKPDILKHRFVDSGSGNRIFEYYDFAPEPFSEIEIQGYWDHLESQLPNQDIIIVADYGHGFLSQTGIRTIEKNAGYLAVNTQANAGNRGYNTIAKYERADLICLNGGELQLELRERNPNYLQMVPKYIERMQARHAIVTLGADGLMVFDSNGDNVRVPALSTKVVDKVGAGDSVLAIASMLSFINAPIEVIGFLSNIVAANEIEQLGHSKSMTIVDLQKSVKGLLG